MFEIYQFGFVSGLWDKDYLKQQVDVGALSEADYHKIVGDSDETNASPLE